MYKYANSIPKEQFERFIPLVVSLAEHIWNKPNEERIDAINDFLEEASNEVDIDKPKFIYEDNKIAYALTGGARYVPALNTIFMYHKFSLITLLHEFRHAAQHIGIITLWDSDLEEDAKMWSCSLFNYVFPDKYAKAYMRGRIHAERHIKECSDDSEEE